MFAECVTPMKITRAAWRRVAEAAGAYLVEVELVCSDPAETSAEDTITSLCEALGIDG